MRRPRAGTVHAAVAALGSAFLPDIEPPAAVKLRAEDAPIWRSIIRARARDEWSDIDLMHAANLVRCLADIERISGEVGVEGDVVSNARGTQIVNPKHAILETLSRRGVSLTRLLQLHAGTLTEHPARLGQIREGERNARAARAEVETEDDFLALPDKAEA